MLGSPDSIVAQESPPSSLRYTPKWFWAKRRSGRLGCIATVCTHWPYSGNRWSSGRYVAWIPRFAGCQVTPRSAERYTPAVDIATISQSGSDGWVSTVCRHAPPPPGSHSLRYGWFQSPSTSAKLSPPSSERKSA